MLDSSLVAIALGIFFGVVFSEAFSLSAGGMVVPGFLALILRDVSLVVQIFAIALATSLSVRLIGRYTVIYGRRQISLTLLISFCLNIAAGQLLSDSIAGGGFDSVETVFGFVTPGLLAIWFNRQGFIETVCTATISAICIRLAMFSLWGISL